MNSGCCARANGFWGVQPVAAMRAGHAGWGKTEGSGPSDKAGLCVCPLSTAPPRPHPAGHWQVPCLATGLSGWGSAATRAGSCRPSGTGSLPLGRRSTTSKSIAGPSVRVSGPRSGARGLPRWPALGIAGCSVPTSQRQMTQTQRVRFWTSSTSRGKRTTSSPRPTAILPVAQPVTHVRFQTTPGACLPPAAPPLAVPGLRSTAARTWWPLDTCPMPALSQACLTKLRWQACAVQAGAHIGQSRPCPWELMVVSPVFIVHGAGQMCGVGEHLADTTGKGTCKPCATGTVQAEARSSATSCTDCASCTDEECVHRTRGCGCGASARPCPRFSACRALHACMHVML